MMKPFPTCTACQGSGLAARQFCDQPKSCWVCDGARVDIYANDPRVAASSRQAVKFLDSEAVNAAWAEATVTFPEVDYCNLPEGWMDADGRKLLSAQARLTVEILERTDSPAVMQARVTFGLPLEPAS